MVENLDDKKLELLKAIASQLRRDVIEMINKAGSGHPAGALGMADIFSAFYFHILNHDSKNPNWSERDRLILSNGHICPIQYAALARAGYFPIEELKTLRKLGSRLQGHPHRVVLPGIETSSGPLGEGLSQAIGMALAGCLDKKAYRVYCIVSDGEQDCGSHWEAVMLAPKYKLNNLIAVLDRNNIQSDGFTEDILPLESLVKKYEAFNWNVLEINGNDIKEFIVAIEKAKLVVDKPIIIIVKTIPGKGVSFMENDYKWHANVPDKEQTKKALEELTIS